MLLLCYLNLALSMSSRVGVISGAAVALAYYVYRHLNSQRKLVVTDNDKITACVELLTDLDANIFLALRPELQHLVNSLVLMQQQITSADQVPLQHLAATLSPGVEVQLIGGSRRGVICGHWTGECYPVGLIPTEPGEPALVRPQMLAIAATGGTPPAGPGMQLVKKPVAAAVSTITYPAVVTQDARSGPMPMPSEPILSDSLPMRDGPLVRGLFDALEALPTPSPAPTPIPTSFPEVCSHEQHSPPAPKPSQQLLSSSAPSEVVSSRDKLSTDKAVTATPAPARRTAVLALCAYLWEHSAQMPFYIHPAVCFEEGGDGEVCVRASNALGSGEVVLVVPQAKEIKSTETRLIAAVAYCSSSISSSVLLSTRC